MAYFPPGWEHRTTTADMRNGKTAPNRRASLPAHNVQRPILRTEKPVLTRTEQNAPGIHQVVHNKPVIHGRDVPVPVGHAVRREGEPAARTTNTVGHRGHAPMSQAEAQRRAEAHRKAAFTSAPDTDGERLRAYPAKPGRGSRPTDAANILYPSKR